MSSPSDPSKLTAEQIEEIHNYRELQSIAREMDIPAKQTTVVLRQSIIAQLTQRQVPPGSTSLNETIIQTPPSQHSPDGSSQSMKKKSGRKPRPKMSLQFGYPMVLETTSIFILIIAIYVLFNCVRGASSTLECLASEKTELMGRVSESYTRLVDTVQKPDPRFHALTQLHEIVKGMEGASKVDQIFEDITHMMTDEINRKGTSVLLYCFSGREVCHKIIKQVVTSVESEPRFKPCLVSLKAQGHDDEDLAGRTQKKLTRVLRDCTNAVIVFEDLDRMSRGELIAFLNALSEGGSLMHDGKSIASNHALYLLTMPGKAENKQVDMDRMTFTARQEFYASIIKDSQQNNSSLSEIAAPFRR
eukprot:g2010.t1